MKKKILIIIIILLILALAAALAWYFFFRKSEKKAKPVLETEGRILDQIMEYPALSLDKKWIYFYSREQIPAFYRTNLETKETEQISEELDGIEEIKYSPDRQKVVFKVIYNQDRFEQYGSPFKEPEMEDHEPRLWVYNFESRALSYLNEQIDEIVFSADSQKLIYSFLKNDGKFSINQSELDGTNYKKITDWSGDEPILKIKDGEFLLSLSLTEEEGENENNGLYQIYIQTGRMDLLSKENYNDFYFLSPDKTKVFFLQTTVEGDDLLSQYWTFLLKEKETGEIFQNKEINFDPENIVWSQDEESCYLAASLFEEENSSRLYQLFFDGRDPELLLQNEGSEFEVVSLDDSGKYLYYLMDSQLYKVKL